MSSPKGTNKTINSNDIDIKININETLNNTKVNQDSGAKSVRVKVQDNKDLGHVSSTVSSTGNIKTTIKVNEQLEKIDVNVNDIKENIKVVISDTVPAKETISKKEYNRLVRNPDGLYVSDQFVPNPLAYYILSKN